jgi:hypothetical protein
LALSERRRERERLSEREGEMPKEGIPLDQCI